jgi:hypothetical protein
MIFEADKTCKRFGGEARANQFFKMEKLLGWQLYCHPWKTPLFKGWQYNCHPNIVENGSALGGKRGRWDSRQTWEKQSSKGLARKLEMSQWM